MKNWIIGILIAADIFLVGGCSTTSTTSASQSRFQGGVMEYNIVTDSKTGCQYLEGVTYGNGSRGVITPLLTEEGAASGCKAYIQH